MTTARWLDNRSKSVITLSPILGGGRGYTVKIETNEPIPSDYLRQTCHGSFLAGAERVAHLITEILPGEWVPVDDADRAQ